MPYLARSLEEKVTLVPKKPFSHNRYGEKDSPEAVG